MQMQETAVSAVSPPRLLTRETSGAISASIWPVFCINPPNAMAMITMEFACIIDSIPPAVSRVSSSSTPVWPT